MINFYVLLGLSQDTVLIKFSVFDAIQHSHFIDYRKDVVFEITDVNPFLYKLNANIKAEPFDYRRDNEIVNKIDSQSSDIEENLMKVITASNSVFYNKRLVSVKHDILSILYPSGEIDTKDFYVYVNEFSINFKLQINNLSNTSKLKSKANDAIERFDSIVNMLNEENWTYIKQISMLNDTVDVYTVSFKAKNKDGDYSGFSTSFELYPINRWNIDVSSGLNFIIRNDGGANISDWNLEYKPFFSLNLNIYKVKPIWSRGFVVGISTNTENVAYNFGLGLHVGHNQRFGFSVGTSVSEFGGDKFIAYPYFGFYYNLSDKNNVFKKND